MYSIGTFTEDKKNNERTITSLEVAEMVEKQHKELLRDIRTYIEYLKQANEEMEELGERKIALTDFFIESNYLSEQNKILPCYDITRKGCEYIATKLTGVKGAVFTAKFINRFHDMEEQIKSNALPMTYRDAVAQLLESLDREEELKAQLDTSKDWYSIKRVAALNGVSWKTFKWRRLKEVGEQMGYEVKKIFDANYGEVNTYHREVWEAAYPDYEI